jgi:urease accessory protein
LHRASLVQSSRCQGIGDRLIPRRATTTVLKMLFAVFHGMAHAQEQPLAVSIAAYAAGFMASTAMLHGIGLLLSLRSKVGARLTGLPIAAAGFWMLARIAG